MKRKQSSLNLKNSEGFIKDIALEFLPKGGESRRAWLEEKRGKCNVAMEEDRDQ